MVIIGSAPTLNDFNTTCLVGRAVSGAGGASLRITAASIPGVMHRFESDFSPRQLDIFSASSAAVSPTSAFKCPCCRDSTSQMYCPTCITSMLRLNKLREQRRAVFLHKASICQQIETQLREEMNFESDYRKKQLSVQELKRKIAAKQQGIDSLRRRIASLEVNISKNKKNVVLLEKKMDAHCNRIAKTGVENEGLQSQLYRSTEKLNKGIAFAASLLSAMFPLCQTMETAGNGGEKECAWTAGGARQRQKKYLYTVNRCSINDNCAYDELRLELVEGSSLSLSPTSREAFAALLYSRQFTEAMATILNTPLPYKRLAKDVARTARWTDDLFATDVFRLNYCIVKLCLEGGVPIEMLNLLRPFSNLFQMLAKLRDEPLDMADRGTVGGSEMKLRHQISEEFNKVKWEEQRHNFTLDNVEEDWVSVDFALK